MISISPYLVYEGNCEEAFNFYNAVFFGESLYIGRYKDVPEDAKKFFPNAVDENVMHAALRIGDGTIIMGNDSPDTNKPSAAAFPRDFYLYINVADPKEAIRIFHELSIGGEIIVPIAETFWSPCYGVLTDKFGIHWKITSHADRN
jgi:PhnB protein